LKNVLAAFILLLGTLAGGVSAQTEPVAPPVADPAGKAPSPHQDSLRLTRLTSGVMPPDGLISIGLGGRSYSTVHLLNGFLQRVSQKDAYLQTELALFRWLNVWAEVPWRTWSGGGDYIPESGSGLGDGTWQVSVGRALVGPTVNLVLYGGGNLPVGDDGKGLAEGVFSPRAGAALTFRLWTENQVPEMRIHLNGGYDWNKAEDLGYGMGPGGFQPWAPRYQSEAAAGGPLRNDAYTFGAAVEFRKQATSLWLEFSGERFRDNDTVAAKERLRLLGAGLRWGLSGGWALHGNYLVTLANDDETTAWFPAYPDWLMGVGVSRQFSVGGIDRDDDGIPDRLDHCPDLAEDPDGWLDTDGCPDYDNDSDGVPDSRDASPMEPEDFDGFEDTDGAPDRDNDGDGFADRDDLCPDEAEDFDGHNDDDGCPDEFADRDGDGVEDSRDGCPDDPEDQDGFEDADGCPDTDNDLDGIPDAADDCPDEPEDYDGEADGDGCPE
jgi:hypothetical protein